MCQNPDVASFTVKYLDCTSSGRMSSGVLAHHSFLSITLFKSFGSKHSLRLLSSFITGTIELIHLIGKGWVFLFIVIELLNHETYGDLGLCVVLDLVLVAALCSSWAVWSSLGVFLRLSIDCAIFVDCRLWFVVFRYIVCRLETVL